MKICVLYKHGFICHKCGDGISYPEKFMFSVLEQLEVDFITQYSKPNEKWCNNYRYDFYFEHNNEKYILETHGLQHYKKCTWKTLTQVKENDKLKKELALQNGIKEENYIIIDCRKSELEWIKKNVLNSKLNEIFDLNKIDWLKCEEFGRKNIIKVVCEYWCNRKNNETASDLSKIFKLNRNTIAKYLKQGCDIGWCIYEPKKESYEGRKKAGKSKGKKVEIFKNKMSLGTFESCAEIERQSEELFGVKLLQNSISRVCRGGINKTYMGFVFKYID